MPDNNHNHADTDTRTVATRHVFYISGFDPRGASYYHRIYREEAARQARVSGPELSVGKRRRTDDNVASWDVDTHISGQRVHTTYDFLRWDDIVRSYWPRGEARLLLVMLRTFWVYIRSGVLLKVLQTAWPTFITTIYPPLFLLAVLGCATGLALCALLVLPVWLGIPTALLVFYGVIMLGRFLEGRNNAYWLLRLYAFFVYQANNEVPEFEARLDKFAARILAQVELAQDDEILIIGHSTGAQVAVSLVARMLRKNHGIGSSKPRIALLTLGECIPMLSFLPAAQACRDDLALVSSTTDIDWLDFTAPPDGACFALVDPVTISGIPRQPGATVIPKLLSPRFFKLFSPREYAAIKRDRLRIHFQYLMAGDLAGEYDYFAITAGPVFLGDRYRNTEPSKGFDKFKVFHR
jgi:pimeloyl-ACP methyl ester carboxylesterase